MTWTRLRRFVADAILGIDTLWGGDVMCASGTGRFIADSWFSDEPLPLAYLQNLYVRAVVGFEATVLTVLRSSDCNAAPAQTL